MPLILVVDRDERVPGRVRSALGPEGWTVTHVRDVTQALQSAGSEAPDLFLVSSELPSARDLLATFARRRGGPGTLALVPDPATGGEGGDPGLGEDGSVRRSFDEPELRAVVESILETPDRPARASRDEPKLTSHDIFGDLVAEVERETGVREPVPPRSAAPPGRRSMDDDIERKLEQTLSGVLGPGSSAPRSRPSAASKPSAAGGAGDDDLDKLISETLSGLELPGQPRKRRPAPATPKPGSPRPAPPPAAAGPRPGAGAPAKPERPSFDLSDFEALVGRSKKARAAAGAPAPPRPATPPPAAPAAPPAAPPSETSGVPFGSLFSETMKEVPEAEAHERVVEAAASGRDGKEFGQYHLLDRIGVGGMAEVWKARMRGVEGFQKTVAIKRILPHLTDSPDFVEMFVDEAKLAAQLNHANIIHIYDLGKLGDDYYIAMEYVEGQNLREILNRSRERGLTLPTGIALHIAARLASALDYAHRKRDFEDRDLGLVHRDVSPQNVLVGYEGTIKLCDFGIVKAVSKSSHTQMGALKGKLQYMSPEQAWGRSVDGRSDIFAVGCLLFEMLAGRRLFVGESEMEVLEAVRECRVQPPSELHPGLEPTVDEVVLKTLAREPGERFQTASELERRLEEILAAMRPAPGQNDLAIFMARLFDLEPPVAPAEEPVAAPAAPPAAAAAGPPAAAAPAPRPRPAPAAPQEPAWEPPPPTADAPAVPAEGGEVPVPAVAPVRAVEADEGGRGKALLVAAIVVAIILGGLLAWYLWSRRSGEGAGPASPEPVEQVVPPAPEPAVPPAPEEGEPQDGVPQEGAAASAAATPEAGEPAEETSEAEPQDGAAPAREDLTETIDKAVAEGLARREEILRKQFEEEERRLQRQLDALDKAAREPVPTPQPAAKAPSKPPRPQPDEPAEPAPSPPPPPPPGP